jgi:CRISPR-associated protein Cmr6
MPPRGVLGPGLESLRRLFAATNLPEAAHAGLVFDRYLALWEGEPAAARRAREVYAPLRDFVDAFNVRIKDGLAAAALAALQRRLDRLAARLEARTLLYRATGRFATGLGSFHPLGNGFSFDPTLGVPFLPGSAVKGLCRACPLAREDPGKARELLGPERVGPGERAATGDLVFFDAYPTIWPRLAVDVINCHHPEYYRSLEGGLSRAAGTRRRTPPSPRETESPLPVFFLCVAEETIFAFRLASRSRSTAAIEDGMAWLNEGLTLLGAGAKTAVGYGAFEPTV